MTGKILAVDDTDESRKILSFFLRKAGYEVLEARDGEEALAMASRSQPDLILLDIVMPQRDGYSTCAALKRDDRTKNIPVIFLSALDDSKEKIKGLEIGGIDYITKSFDRRELLARVQLQFRLLSLTREILQANKELLEKQKRLDEDLKAAAGIQQSLLPQKLPDMDSLKVAWKFVPSDQIGGDIFNLFRLDEDHFGLYMLDVSGHGVPAAMVSVSVSQRLQTQTGDLLKGKKDSPPFYEIIPPNKVLQILDREYPIERFDKYFTMVYLVINCRDGYLRYSNAAHPPPVLLRRNGPFELLHAGGSIIGLGGRLPFEEERKNLTAGDKIIFYTDGVIECQNNEGVLFGEGRLHGLLERLRGESIDRILEGMLESVLAFSRGVGLKDDVTLLAVELAGKE